MVSVTMATSEWIQFFKEAGIPAGPAVSYAVMFVDNRIRKNMLLDLNKELMNELGITLVGDIIAILKHAKVVYRQEMCKAATESLCPSPAREPRRNVGSAATRMIANSLSRDSPPARPDPGASKISVTVSNKNAKADPGDTGIPAEPAKRRRVTAEMEGKYIIRMPKGTTPRSRKILEQQAAKGLRRTSVFQRLGAEAGADSTTAGKPAGVFSRLGDAPDGNGDNDGDNNGDNDDDDDDDSGSVLQYAGVLKAKATSSVAAVPRGRRTEPPTGVTRGTAAVPPAVPPQDSSVTSTRGRAPLRVTLRRGRHGAAGSPGARQIQGIVRGIPPAEGPGMRGIPPAEGPGARMDSAGPASVFARLGRKAQ